MQNLLKDSLEGVTFQSLQIHTLHPLQIIIEKQHRLHSSNNLSI